MSPTITANILTQAESAHSRNMAYLPGQSFGDYALRCANEGWLLKRQTSGYDITAAGKRELARLRAAKVRR